MSDFHFLRPLWLLALLPLFALGWHVYRSTREGGDWRRICDPALLPHILIHDHGGQSARRTSLLFHLAGVLAILALAGPVWERLPAPAFRNDAALVIALDLSRIMETPDVKPSRLERARFKITDILQQRKDGLTALLVYSGDAFTVSPLTDDSNTISSQLPALTSELMPAQGSRADLALDLAGRLLKQAGLLKGDVLLMTNGGSLVKAADQAKALKAQGYRVSVLGVGTEDGAPVPLPEGGFLQDGKGNIVVSKLAAPALAQLAQDGGGLYRKLATDNADLKELLGFFERQGPQGQAAAGGPGVQIERWEERGVWLLLLLLPIAALAFRRGILAAIVLLVLPVPKQAQAMDWQDLWLTRDQQASRALQAGDPAKAAQLFDDPAWKAAALYQAGQYEEAAKLLQAQEMADGQYNRGNALAKQGQLPEAIAAYEQALKLDPQHEDARHNKEEVEKALKKQQQEQSKDQNKDKDQQGKDQQGKDQQGEDQLDKDQQGKDQQGKDQQGKDQQGKDQQGKDQQGKDQQGKDQQGKDQQGQDGQPSDQGKQDGKSPQDPSKDGQQSEAQSEQGQGQQQGQEQQAQPDQDQGKAGRQQGREKSEKSQEEGQSAAGEEGRLNEAVQANEQWLRRIPDDPGGLLRRKFQYQYQQRQGRRGTAQ